MSVKTRKNTTSTTEGRRFGEHLSAAVEAMESVYSELTQAREQLKEKKYEIDWALKKASDDVKSVENRLYRAGYNYWRGN